MTRKRWDVMLGGRPRSIEARHGYWSARRLVSIDGVEVFRYVPKSFREQTDLWQTSTQHPFTLDGHTLALRVRPGIFQYDIELIVDGRSADDGLPAGPLRRPAFAPYGWTGVKIAIAFIAFLAYVLAVIVPFGTFARENGPRWILASNALFDLAFPAFAFSVVVFAWQSRLRGRNVAIALLLFAAASYAFRGFPAEAADLVLPLDEDTIAFAGWEPGPVDLRRVRLLGGPEVEFGNNVPIRWRHLPPGMYVLVRGHISRVIVDMRAVSDGR